MSVARARAAPGPLRERAGRAGPAMATLQRPDPGGPGLPAGRLPWLGPPTTTTPGSGECAGGGRRGPGCQCPEEQRPQAPDLRCLQKALPSPSVWAAEDPGRGSRDRRLEVLPHHPHPLPPQRDLVRRRPWTGGSPPAAGSGVGQLPAWRVASRARSRAPDCVVSTATRPRKLPMYGTGASDVITVLAAA